MLRAGYSPLNNAGMFDWDDIKVFLAVARAGSTLGAARELRASQPTVGRRVAALEQAAGVKLFERLRTGYSLTPAGREILPLAEQAEQTMAAIRESIESRSRRLAGSIRVTAAEPVANLFLGPAVAEFQRSHSSVEIQLLISDRFLDLAKEEADVASARDHPRARQLGADRPPPGRGALGGLL